MSGAAASASSRPASRTIRSVLTSHVSRAPRRPTPATSSTPKVRASSTAAASRASSISASAKAADGTDLSTFETFEAVEPDGLPDDKTLLAAIDRVANDVTNLLTRSRGRAVRRPGDLLRPRRRRLLPRNLRPPRGGPPPEGRKRRPDLHQERRHQGAARLPFGGLRPHPAQDRRRRSERLVRLRRRRRQGAAGARRRQGRAEDVPDVALAHQGLRPFQRPRPPPARARSGLAAIEPDRANRPTRCPTRSCARC